MLKLCKEQFLLDKELLCSTISLLSDSYLKAEDVLERALANSDFIYINEENKIVSSIALYRKVELIDVPNIKIVYIGLTAARKSSIKGMAFKLVEELLKDNLKYIESEKDLFAISTISTPFTYNYYKRFTKELYPTENGDVSESIEKIFDMACKHLFHLENKNTNSWRLKNYTNTRYNSEEIEKINTYLSKNKLSIFDSGNFNLSTGDRIAVIGIVDKMKIFR